MNPQLLRMLERVLRRRDLGLVLKHWWHGLPPLILRPLVQRLPVR